MLLKYENIISELESNTKYRHLYKAVKHYWETEGKPEHDLCLPNLIVWIRQVVPDTVDIPDYFEMGERVKEDFYSWGHNSRWSNTFWSFLNDHFCWCVALCMDLADEYGDYDVETYIQSTIEKQKQERKEF